MSLILTGFSAIFTGVNLTANLGWVFRNDVSTIGAFVVGASFLFFLANLVVSWRRPVPAGDNPWDAQTLEWYTTSPPPHHNYTRLPPIRSERPTWDVNHPEWPITRRQQHKTPKEPVTTAKR